MGRTRSVVIPALNEEQNIEAVLSTVPRAEPAARGWVTEAVVVDNGLTEADGGVMVTGDADRTYPFDHVPQTLELFLRHDLEFLTTDRLLPSNKVAMQSSRSFGNHALSALFVQVQGDPGRVPAPLGSGRAAGGPRRRP